MSNRERELSIVTVALEFWIYLPEKSFFLGWMNIFHVSDQLPAVTKISTTIWTMDTIVGDTVEK